MPGQPADGGANPAAFPRPAGGAAQVDAQVGPPPPYSPFNCKPEFVRMTSFAVPNSQVGAGAAQAGRPQRKHSGRHRAWPAACGVLCTGTGLQQQGGRGGPA